MYSFNWKISALLIFYWKTFYTSNYIINWFKIKYYFCWMEKKPTSYELGRSSQLLVHWADCWIVLLLSVSFQQILLIFIFIFLGSYFEKGQVFQVFFFLHIFLNTTYQVPILSSVSRWTSVAYRMYEFVIINSLQIVCVQFFTVLTLIH